MVEPIGDYEDLEEREDHQVERTKPRERGTASRVLMAMMLSIGDLLGMERPKDETVEVADAPSGDDSLKLDYKHLDPLE